MNYSNLRDANDLFAHFFGGGLNDANFLTSSITTKKENEDDYEINYTKDGAYLLFSVPGFNKTNLRAEIEDGTLHIVGKRTYKLTSGEKTKSINKKFKIGDEYNPSLIEATIEDGLLTVFVPNYKKQEKKRINLL